MSLHLEHITRAALRALGGSDEQYAWDGSIGGIVEVKNGAPTGISFAPLRDPADAFQLEALLRLDVVYERGEKHVQLAVLCPLKSGQMKYVSLLPESASKEIALVERMRAVTQFAALLDNLDIAEN
jgi:hypothetical protein